MKISVEKTVLALMLLAAPGICAPAQAELSLAQKLDILVKSYPSVLAGVEGNHLLFRDGGPPLVIDDGQTKTHQEKLKDADIEDMLSQFYPLGPCASRPAVNFDPGRIRVDGFFRRLYGASKAQVKQQLVRVQWFGTRLWVHRAHGAAEALKRVRDEIAKLPKALRKPAMKSAGTFNWRTIAGTKRLSVHSFGAAVDLDVKYSNYWRWSGGKPGRVPIYTNRIPLEIVDIFERHGFVWGGRWYHYDTMHFEYRPALIAISRAAGASACR